MVPYSAGARMPPEYLNELTDRVLQALEMPTLSRAEVYRALESTSERTGISYVDAEIKSLPTRFGLAVLSEQSELSRNPCQPSTQHGALTFLRHYSPARVPAGAELYRSVRIRAHEQLRASGPSAVRFHHSWRKLSTRRAWTLKEIIKNLASSRPTPLPIDIESSREITVAVQLTTPADVGSYELSIFPRRSGKSAIALPLWKLYPMRTLPRSPSKRLCPTTVQIIERPSSYYRHMSHENTPLTFDCWK